MVSFLHPRVPFVKLNILSAKIIAHYLIFFYIALLPLQYVQNDLSFSSSDEQMPFYHRYHHYDYDYQNKKPDYCYILVLVGWILFF